VEVEAVELAVLAALVAVHLVVVQALTEILLLAT
jgi:hypothetical protein